MRENESKTKVTQELFNERTISDESIVEALIAASPEPISEYKISRATGIDPQRITKIVDDLNRQYRNSGRSFEIRYIAGGYSFYVLPDFAPWLEELASRTSLHITRSMLEVLAIVAVKQPVTKKVIDKIRGVNSIGPLQQLLSERLITIKGRAKTPGKPFIYVITKRFLKLFGLEKDSDIPKIEELKELFEEK